MMPEQSSTYKTVCTLIKPGNRPIGTTSSTTQTQYFLFTTQWMKLICHSDVKYTPAAPRERQAPQASQIHFMPMTGSYVAGGGAGNCTVTGNCTYATGMQETAS